jgi:hypothetical protein
MAALGLLLYFFFGYAHRLRMQLVPKVVVDFNQDAQGVVQTPTVIETKVNGQLSRTPSNGTYVRVRIVRVGDRCIEWPVLGVGLLNGIQPAHWTHYRATLSGLAEGYDLATLKLKTVKVVNAQLSFKFDFCTWVVAVIAYQRLSVEGIIGPSGVQLGAIGPGC